MTKFEDNLWREVERKYGSELSEAEGPLQRRSRLRVPVIAGTSVAVVGASAAALVVLTAANSSPAFAVTRYPDGTVSVVIRRIEGIEGANRRLARLGIRARAVRVSDVCRVTPPQALARVTVATLIPDRHVVRVGGANGKVLARIRPTQIPSGRTLIIPAVPGGALVRLVHAPAVRGAVPACLPPAVLIRRPGSGSGGGRIVTCRAGIPQHTRPVTPGQETNTTATNAAPPPPTDTGTTTQPGTVTNTATATNPTNTTNTTNPTNTTNTTNPTNTTGATDSGTSTNGGPAAGSPPPGPNVALPPRLLRACLVAAQGAAR